MNNLEKLVPPLELCRKIPVGKFEDSALVLIFWRKGPNPPEIRQRREVESDPYFDDLVEDERIIIYPAPTLQEILEALYTDADGCCIHAACYRDGDGWEACVVYECHDDSGYGGDHAEVKDKNPATAALRLWLEVEGVE